MTCATCERMRARMKQWLARKTGQEWTDGQASATTVPAAHEAEVAGGQEASDQTGQPAGQPYAQHEQRGMEGDTPASAER